MNIYEKTLYQRPEGIDTISVMIHGECVNPAMWELEGKKQKKLTYGFSVITTSNWYHKFFYFNIQAECLQMDNNILEQVLWAVYNELYIKGFLNPCIFKSDDMARYLIFNNYKEIMRLNKVHFNFDFKENEIHFNPYGKKCYEGTTYYSKKPRDANSKTTFYDRRANLIAKNQISHEKIHDMERPLRCEIKMESGNCHYMDLDNLNGNYDYIVHNNWYSPIARAIGKFFPQNICTEELLKGNPYFCEFQTLFVQNPRKRNSKTLLRTPSQKRKNCRNSMTL